MWLLDRITNFVRPTTGEQTKPQSTSGMAQFGSGTSSDVWRLLMAAGTDAGCGSYKTYREMMCHPTIALCHAAATAPIIAAGWSVEHDDDAPPEAVTLIEDVFEKHRAWLLMQACRAIYYGWQSFEKVWEIDDDNRLVIDKFKPLVPDRTEIVVDKDHGTVMGIKQDSVQLDLGHCMILTYDQEGDNLYGRSRLENIRRWAYQPWCIGAAKLEQYQGKAAGIIPVVRFPVGQGMGANGVMESNAIHASRMLDRLSSTRGIIAPNTLPDWAQDVVRNGGNMGELMEWQFDFLETRSGHGAEFITSLSYQDKLMVRGYLLPERAILEGQFGTKAEAGVHGDIAVLISQQWLDHVVCSINEQAVDDVLEANFGRDMRGKVYLTPGPIQDAKIALYTNIVTALLTGNPDLAMSLTDIDAMLDALSLPKAAETVGGPLLPQNPPDPNAPPAPVAPTIPPSLSRAIMRRIRGK